MPALSVVLKALRRKDGAVEELVLPLAARQTFRFKRAQGRGSVSVRERHEGSTRVFRLTAEARLAKDWIFHEAALRLEIQGRAWRGIIPSGWGREIADWPENFEYTGNYPGWSALAQLMILAGRETCLSFSARDPETELKYLRMRRKGDVFTLEIARVPELDGSGAWKVEGACELLLSVFKGDWDQAAEDYRRQQEKVRPELKPHCHSLLQNDPFWLTHNCFAYPPHTLKDSLNAIRALDAPVLIHQYNWSAYAFDTHYPDVVEDRPGLAQELRALEHAGAHNIPYLNDRCWDTTIPSWKASGRRGCVLKSNGKRETEIYAYSSNIDLGVACPAWTDHHRRVLAGCLGVVQRHGLKGVYLDQVGAAYGLRCYARNHGHRPGGAKSWNSGYLKNVALIRSELAKSLGAPPFLCIENSHEALVHLLDGFLYFCGKSHEKYGRPIPLWQALYGDCGLGFADNFDVSEEEKKTIAAGGVPAAAFRRIARKLARQAIFGISLGWIPPTLTLGRWAPIGTLMRNCRAARLPHFKRIRQALPVPSLLVTDAETNPFEPVMLSGWRAGKETIVLAVNPGTSPAQFHWPDGSKLTLRPLAAASRVF